MTHEDVLLVTIESARDDHRDHLQALQALDYHTGVSMAPWTRPSIAGLLSSQYTATIDTSPTAPTLPDVLRVAGYETAGFSYSPQCTSGLGFDDGFQTYPNTMDNGSRGSKWREYLATHRTVRALHRRLNPKSATLESIQSDEATVAEAIEWWHETSGPRFCWVHLMDSHRPYGRGDQALPDRVGRRATAASPSPLRRSLTDLEAETVHRHYQHGLARTARRVRRLWDAVGDSTALVVAGDHGEELGEHGYYFHGPYRQRTPRELTHVPIYTNNLDLPDPLSLADIAPAITATAGVDAPSQWAGRVEGSRPLVTVAPWAGTCSIAIHTPEETVRFEDAAPAAIARMSPNSRTEEHLAALGYR